MITTLRKAQDSWITKGILILTAMSFMSLFGISGYIDSAAGNRAVIKVNDREINQQEINLQLNDEIRTAQKLFGDLEITDEIRNNMLAGLVELRRVDTDLLHRLYLDSEALFFRSRSLWMQADSLTAKCSIIFCRSRA